MAAPVFNPNMTMNPFRKHLSHDIEDRDNQGLLILTGSYFYLQFIFLSISFSFKLGYIRTIINCAFDPTTCTPIVPPPNI